MTYVSIRYIITKNFKIEQRKERLELFEKKIEEIPSHERYILDSSKIETLKSIYKLNGIMDVNIDSFEPQTTSDYLKYLMDVTCSKIKKILILILQVIYKH